MHQIWWNHLSCANISPFKIFYSTFTIQISSIPESKLVLVHFSQMVRHEKPRVQIPPDTQRKNTIKIPGIHFPLRSACSSQGISNKWITSSCLDTVSAIRIEWLFSKVLNERHRDVNTKRNESPSLSSSGDSFQTIRCAHTQRQPREELGTNALNAFPESLQF